MLTNAHSTLTNAHRPFKHMSNGQKIHWRYLGGPKMLFYGTGTVIIVQIHSKSFRIRSISSIYLQTGIWLVAFVYKIQPVKFIFWIQNTKKTQILIVKTQPVKLNQIESKSGQWHAISN